MNLYLLWQTKKVNRHNKKKLKHIPILILTKCAGVIQKSFFAKPEETYSRLNVIRVIQKSILQKSARNHCKTSNSH